ncbi:MAG: hypothetical protein H7Z12_10295 [Rhodospirillaceae bacterium]|nr:hypothetical protein [Rhodospirillales bacterium]
MSLLKHVAGVSLLLVLVLALSGCARGPFNTLTQPLPPQMIESKGGITLINTGEIDGTNYTLLTTLRMFPSADKVALCGAARVLSTKDVSARLREGMEMERSTLTLTRKPDAVKLVVSPRFIPVADEPRTEEGKAPSLKMSELGGQQGGCVVTNSPWQEQWSNLQFSPALALFVHDTRKRQQTVVGPSGEAR